MGKEVIPLIKTTSNPTSGNTTSNGYPLGQHWFNETSGVEFIHKSNGCGTPLTLHKLIYSMQI